MKNWGMKKPVGLADRWPKTPEGAFEAPRLLQTVCGSRAELEITVNMLEAYGIPVLCTGIGNGDFGKIILGYAASGSALYVPESCLEDAENLLKAEIVNED